MKNWLFETDPDAGKHWRQEEKGTTEDEMVGRLHWLSGHEFEQLLEMVKDREAWHAAVHEVAESDMTEWLKKQEFLSFLRKLHIIFYSGCSSLPF